MNKEYRGAIIRNYYGQWEWEHPEYVDCELVGEDWRCTGCGHGNSIQDCEDAIDEFLETIKESEK